MIWVAGANVAECAPITTNYLWQARERGAKVIVQDPRITPTRPHLRSVSSGQAGPDAALFAGVLNLMIEQRLDRSRRSSTRTPSGFDAGGRILQDWTPQQTAEVTGVPERSIRAGRRVVGHRQVELHPPRARDRASLATACQNALGAINLVLASGRIGKPNCGYGTIVGQANGQGGREHGQKCDQLPGWRDISNPEHRRLHRHRCGASTRGICPGRASTRTRCSARSTRARSRGCSAICFNPKVSLPDNNFVTRALEKLEFFVGDRLLPERHGAARRHRPAGSLQEEDEGTVTQVEGRVIKINKAVDPPGEARADWRIIQDIAAALGRPHGFTFASPARDLRGAARRQQGRRGRLLRRSPTRRSSARWASSGPAPPRSANRTPDAGPSGHAAAVRARSYNPIAKGAGPFYFPDGKARFNVADYRPPAEDARSEYPLFLTTGRVVSQFLSGTQTRRIGPLVKQYPEPRIELHPRLADKLGIADGDWATAETRRGAITLQALGRTTIRPDTIFIPYHWAGPKEPQPADRRRAGSDQQDPPVQGVRLPARARPSATRRMTSVAGTAAVRATPMPVPSYLEFFIDPSRCIGCQSCVQACSECETHRGESMIHLEYVDRAESVQTVPVVCMHCEQPTCAEVCPADAIKRTEDGVVQSARKPRCIACGNCVLACPFGVPRALRRQADHDEVRHVLRPLVSVGKKPMCATVCPSQALFFGTREEIRSAAAPVRRRPTSSGSAVKRSPRGST